MTTVSLNSIEEAANKINTLETDALIKLSESRTEEQKQLFGYLYSVMLDYENPDLEDLVPYYFYIILEAFEIEKIKVGQVTDEDLEAFDDEFIEILNDLYDSNNMEQLEEFCDQPWLLEFMKVEVNGEDDEGNTLSEQTAEELFIISAAMIALLNRKIEA